MASEIIAYQEQLSSFGVSLHRAILDQLVGDVEKSIEDGQIRVLNGKCSIYDFIASVLGKKSQWEVWKRFVAGDTNILAFCENIRYPGLKGAAKATPATDIVGLIYVAYMANCEFSQKLRQSSAVLIAKDRKDVGQKQDADDRIKRLEQALADTHEALDNFPNTLERLHQITGIVNKYQIRDVILRDFVEGRDYIWADGRLTVNESTFNILVTSFRSTRGADISQLPEIIKLNTVEYFRVHRRRKNDRLAHRTNEDQMSLFDCDTRS